ncbi:hypothetical protein D7V80_08940 [Corallococcus sp. CA054B]|nr:hypothetical protein D7V80_08940 [Corallococcus sp. CA054B]
MSFFEVLSPVPQKMDMGGDLPLRFHTRPLFGQVVWPLLTLVLFVVIPLAYALDQGLSLARLREEWMLPLVVVLGGFVSVTFILRCVRTRLEVVVTAREVILRGAGALSAFTWSEPLDHYVGLDCERRHHPDWIGAQDEYGIALTHREDPERNVVVHWGRDARRFEDRLARYAHILRLPIRREQRAPLAQARAARR